MYTYTSSVDGDKVVLFRSKYGEIMLQAELFCESIVRPLADLMLYAKGRTAIINLQRLEAEFRQLERIVRK